MLRLGISFQSCPFPVPNRKGAAVNVNEKTFDGYVISFNKRNRRSGQLFQNRFKSIVCQEDLYLKELVRYIHLHPVKFPGWNPI